MKSIYEIALGDRFSQLHPQLQKKFALHSKSGFMIKSRGVMSKMWGGRLFMTPFFHMSTKSHIAFPERGENIPFTLENGAYVDPFGREAVAWIRRFDFPDVTRHFDATMIFSVKKNRILDYVGTHQSWVTNIQMDVLEKGGLRITTGPQRLYVPFVRRFFPFALLGQGVIEERFDDQKSVFLIHVQVHHALFGTILEYKGEFTSEYVPVDKNGLPSYMLPKQFRREE